MTMPFATALLGWKQSGKNKLHWPLVPNFADVDSAESLRIAAGVLDQLAAARGWPGAADWACRAAEIAPTIVGGSQQHGGPDLGPTGAREA